MNFLEIGIWDFWRRKCEYKLLLDVDVTDAQLYIVAGGEKRVSRHIFMLYSQLCAA